MPVRDCESRKECMYARLFEPGPWHGGPSGLQDWPRPFVIRAAHLDGCSAAPGQRFWFDINLFDTRVPLIDYLEKAFREVAKEGLRLGRLELESVEQLDREGRVKSGPPISIPLTTPRAATNRVRVVFRTPTDLKSNGESIGAADFGVLFARARDRVSTLRALYGAGPLPIDFRSLGERAEAVRTIRSELRHVQLRRRSRRTGRAHEIGGFVGAAEYEGDLTEFLPILDAAQWTGVGRHCVWGNGELQIQSIDHL